MWFLSNYMPVWAVCCKDSAKPCMHLYGMCMKFGVVTEVSTFLVITQVSNGFKKIAYSHL